MYSALPPFRVNIPTLKINCLIVAGLGSFFYSPPHSFADNAATQPKIPKLEEVIVTATKRGQTMGQVPAAVSVVNMDTLNPQATIADIANQVPGFSVLEAGPRGVTPLVIRGLRTDSIDGAERINDGGSVASYIDNMPLQGFFAPPAISLKDLQQVEVLRGPQGTLYGNASIGGLVRYVTAKPDLTKSSAHFKITASHTQESSGINTDADLVINTSIANNSLGTRLLLSKSNNQGFIDNPYLISGAQTDINSDETRQARASLLWKPASAFSLSSSYSYQKLHADDRQASNELFTHDDYSTTSRYLQPSDGTLQLANVESTYLFNMASVTATLSHYDYKNHALRDQTDFYATNFGSYYTDYSEFSAYNNRYVHVTKNSAELRLVSPEHYPLRWLTGVFLSNDDVAAFSLDIVPGFANYSGESRPNDIDYYDTQAERLDEQSLYSELVYDVNLHWEISLGARRYRYKDTATICSLLFPTSIPYENNNYPVDCLNGNDDHTGYLGKISTQYKFTDNNKVYFTVTEGMRRGGTNFLPVEITTHRIYAPDTATNYELGSLSYFLNNSITLNSAIFYINWTDIQLNTIVDGRNITVNAGKARSQGIELALHAHLNTYWSARSTYTYTQAELTTEVNNLDGGNSTAYRGDALPGAPRTKWNLALDYTQNLLENTFKAGVSYARTSDLHTALNSEFATYEQVAGYGTLNAYADVIGCNWKAGIFVNNATNTRGITSKRSDRIFGAQGKLEYITRPRTVGIAVSYQL